MRQFTHHLKILIAKQRSGGRIPLPVVLLFALTLSIFTVVSTQTQTSAQAVFDSAWGTFHSPLRDDDLDIECLQYATGDPASFDTETTIQTEASGVLNQVRSGRIPAGIPLVGGTCSSNPGAETGLGSSGFGFIGASGQNMIDGYFEVGRLFHFNRTVERSLRTVQLSTTVGLLDSVSSGTNSLDVTYVIDVYETPDFAGVDDTSLCEFDVPENRVVTQLGVPTTLCADQLTFTTLTSSSIDLAEGAVTLNIAGFARVENGECDPTQLVTGESIFTAEQDANPLCLLGALEFAPFSLPNNEQSDVTTSASDSIRPPSEELLASTGQSFVAILASAILLITIASLLVIRRQYWHYTTSNK